MTLWQRRIERAEELARLFPISAQLMYFYRDIARFQIARPEDVSPLLGLPEGRLAAYCRRVLDDSAGACDRPPSLSVWRASGRALQCPFCSIERPIASGECPRCLATSLRIHGDDEFPHIRIEACDACRIYLKAVDLTQAPSAIPEVDDLASVPLDIWAYEHGYQRVTPNLFGL